LKALNKQLMLLLLKAEMLPVVNVEVIDVASEEEAVVAVVVVVAVMVVPAVVPPRMNGFQRPSSADLSSTV
jgi:hypothetical protein